MTGAHFHQINYFLEGYIAPPVVHKARENLDLMSANDILDLSLFLNISQIRFLSSISTCIAVILEPFTLTSVVTTPDVRNPAIASNPTMVLLHNRHEHHCLPPTPSLADKARALGLVLLTTVPRLDNTCSKSSSPAVCISSPYLLARN